MWPAGPAKPITQDAHWVAGRPASNLVFVKLGSGGAINLVNAVGTAHAVVDVYGYVT